MDAENDQKSNMVYSSLQILPVESLDSTEERHPWEAVDWEVSPPKTNHMADETEHGETSGARGGERVLDQSSIHDSRAGGGTRD